MQQPTIKLTRNLRKIILRGNPWIYRESISVPKGIKKTTLCKVVDNKDQFICWAMYNPQSPLALRVLTLAKRFPDKRDFEQAFKRACELRKGVFSQDTNCYRLINGEGDYLPGFICDIYDSVAVMQFDGSGPFEFWSHDDLAKWIMNHTSCKYVYYKPRHDSSTLKQEWGQKPKSDDVLVKENNVIFSVDYIHGKKTGFFLDQRENRNYLRKISNGKSVLNLFSYSGGFSVYAGKGGALSVTSVDISQGALDLAEKNWQLNGLERHKHSSLCADVFKFVHELEQTYDIVVCDPPSLAKSEENKAVAVEKYIETFAAAAKRVKSHGHLILSSCSSHVSFDDFMEIVTNSLSKVRRRAQVLRISGQGLDHPFPQACPHLRYLKFIDLVVE